MDAITTTMASRPAQADALERGRLLADSRAARQWSQRLGLEPLAVRNQHGVRGGSIMTLPSPLIDNVVAKQLPRLIADAEALLRVAAWPDLPAGLRIIGCAGGRLAGFSCGSGHGLAEAHGFRPGAVAVAVAAEDALRVSLERWPDELPVALGEAAVMVEAVAAHELAHALVAEPDADLRPGAADILRQLPAAVGTIVSIDSAERAARDHGPAWAAALVVLHRRCMRYRPGARHRWADLLARDLRTYGIDADAVAVAVGDVADEAVLRDAFAHQGAIAARVADAIPDAATRARLIVEQQHETTPADPGHVALVAAGVG